MEIYFFIMCNRVFHCYATRSFHHDLVIIFPERDVEELQKDKMSHLFFNAKSNWEFIGKIKIKKKLKKTEFLLTRTRAKEIDQDICGGYQIL
jgi:hypothetical protein